MTVVVSGVRTRCEQGLLGKCHAHSTAEQLLIMYAAATCLQVFVPFNEDDPNRRIITNAQLSTKDLGTQLGERGSGRGPALPV
jgi:hypothetical protein